MVLDITRFQIRGLHGGTHVDIDIRDDRVVLVGVNGLGKTTIINMLFFFLTRQWVKLAEYQFESVTLTVGGENLTLQSDQLPGWWIGDRVRGFSRHLERRISKSARLRELAVAAIHSPAAAWELSERLGIPTRVLVESLTDLSGQDELFDSDEAPLGELTKLVEQAVPAQTLYLPTYRRIERDLKTILPELEEDIDRYRRMRRSRRRRLAEPEHIEFVEFGMEDVELLLKHALGDLKEGARAAVNKLATNYLIDVIRGRAGNYEEGISKRLLDADMDRVLGRVDDKTMTEFDKDRLRTALESLSEAESQKSPNDIYVAHFLAKLVDVHDALTERERQVTRFVEVCNRYLSGKSLLFDDSAYHVSIELDSGDDLELASLSSGEKQIVSLFAQLFLGGETPLIVLIDEPELSLSVEWQKQLLPDILASSRCLFLAAVTHSPFIFSNELDDSAVDIANCLSYESLGRA